MVSTGILLNACQITSLLFSKPPVACWLTSSPNPGPHVNKLHNLVPASLASSPPHSASPLPKTQLAFFLLSDVPAMLLPFNHPSLSLEQSLSKYPCTSFLPSNLYLDTSFSVVCHDHLIQHQNSAILITLTFCLIYSPPVRIEPLQRQGVLIAFFTIISLVPTIVPAWVDIYFTAGWLAGKNNWSLCLYRVNCT